MKVTILCGASGSGKSTWVKNLGDDGVLVVSADHYFMRNGEYHFDFRKLPEAHNQCLRGFSERLVAHCLAGGDSHLVVDNTNTTVAEIAPYYALASAYGAEVEIRVFSGEYENVHGVPEKSVKAMRERVAKLRDSAPPWWKFVDN